MTFMTDIVLEGRKPEERLLSRNRFLEERVVELYCLKLILPLYYQCNYPKESLRSSLDCWHCRDFLSCWLLLFFVDFLLHCCHLAFPEHAHRWLLVLLPAALALLFLLLLDLLLLVLVLTILSYTRQWLLLRRQLPLLHYFLPSLLPVRLQLRLLLRVQLLLLLLLVDECLEQVLGVDDCLPFVEIFDVFQCLHDIHFPLGVVGLVLEVLHRVFLLLVALESLEHLLCVLCVLDGLVVPGAPRFDDVVVVLGVGDEGDLAVAVGALEVEAEHLDAEVGVLVAYLHAHVELGADVEVVGADVAAQTHRQHVAHHHQLVLAPSPLDDAGVVEVLREVLYQHLPLGHLLQSLFIIGRSRSKLSVILGG